MAITVTDFRRLEMLSKLYSSLDIQKSKYWAAQLIFFVSSNGSIEPHKFLQNDSQAHVAFFLIGHDIVVAEYEVYSHQKAVGFNRNLDKPEWKGNQPLKPFEPLYNVSLDQNLPHNSSGLLALPNSEQHDTETFIVKYSLSFLDKSGLQEQLTGVPFIILRQENQNDDVITEPINNFKPNSIDEDNKMKPQYNYFISYASEDDQAVTRPLAEMIKAQGFEVWYDKFILGVGDSIREKIDEGLNNSEHGIIILSKAFFKKKWPARELDGLMAIQTVAGNKIMPIWHDITYEEVLEYSPMLAGIKGISSAEGITAVVEAIIQSAKT